MIYPFIHRPNDPDSACPKTLRSNVCLSHQVVYVVDTPRCAHPQTFMSNMLQAS